MTTIHTIVVKKCLQSFGPNPVLMQPAPKINPAEQSLPRGTRHILTQLCTGKPSVLCSYLHVVDSSHPSPICPLCKSHDHTTRLLFWCQKINTTLTYWDLWNDPMGGGASAAAVGGCQSAAGGGLGSNQMCGWMEQQTNQLYK